MATPSADRRLEAAVRVLQEITDNKTPRAFGVFKNGMKGAGFTLTAPDAASLYSRAGAIIREREKVARQAPPTPVAGAAASSSAAAAETELQDGAEWYDRDDPPPLMEEIDEDEGPYQPGVCSSPKPWRVSFYRTRTMRPSRSSRSELLKELLLFRRRSRNSPKRPAWRFSRRPICI